VFIGVLQRFIQEHTVPGVLIDVADYSHMHHGPGVILIGHEANISIDYAEGRMGLRYRYRQIAEDSFQDALRTALTGALIACVELERDKDLKGRLIFAGDSVQIAANDRLNAPHDAALGERLVEDVQAVLSSLYSDPATVTVCDADSRERLTVEISGDESTVSTLLERLQAGVAK
ncbi:MAG: hypothetical protein IID08_10880, partial [Candidatus Hydrogenedentes bacterium]|nr:hypothetical protein [Candidatus Hydrogenedentota bacterium]